MTLAQQRSLIAAGKRVRKSTRERDELIRAAVARGDSLRTVGAAVGLSHTAVAQIAERAVELVECPTCGGLSAACPDPAHGVEVDR